MLLGLNLFKSTSSFPEFYTTETRCYLMYSSGGIQLKWKFRAIIGEACMVSTLSSKVKNTETQVQSPGCNV